MDGRRTPPETSNFYCLPGRAGGTPIVLAEPRSIWGGDAGVGGIEIVLPNGARLSVDAPVKEKALSRVLRAMKGAT